MWACANYAVMGWVLSPAKAERREKKPKWKNNVLIDKLVALASSWNPSIWEAEARGLPRVQGQAGQVLNQS